MLTRLFYVNGFYRRTSLLLLSLVCPQRHSPVSQMHLSIGLYRFLLVKSCFVAATIGVTFPREARAGTQRGLLEGVQIY